MVNVNEALDVAVEMDGDDACQVIIPDKQSLPLQRSLRDQRLAKKISQAHLPTSRPRNKLLPDT